MIPSVLLDDKSSRMFLENAHHRDMIKASNPVFSLCLEISESTSRITEGLAKMAIHSEAVFLSIREINGLVYQDISLLCRFHRRVTLRFEFAESNEGVRVRVQLGKLRGLNSIVNLYFQHADVDCSGVSMAFLIELVIVSSTVHNIEELHAVSLSDLKISASIIPPITRFPLFCQLNRLEIIDCELVSLDGIDRFPNLEILKVSQNENLEKIDPILTLKNLRELDVARTKVSILSPLMNVGSLELIKAFENRNIPKNELLTW